MAQIGIWTVKRTPEAITKIIEKAIYLILGNKEELAAAKRLAKKRPPRWKNDPRALLGIESIRMPSLIERTGEADCDDWTTLISALLFDKSESSKIIYAGFGNKIQHVFCESEDGTIYDPYGSEEYERIEEIMITPTGRRGIGGTATALDWVNAILTPAAAITTAALTEAPGTIYQGAESLLPALTTAIPATTATPAATLPPGYSEAEVTKKKFDVTSYLPWILIGLVLFLVLRKGK